MQSFTNLEKGIRKMSFQEVDKSHHGNQLQSLDRAKLYRLDLMLHSMNISHVDDRRSIHVIFPCKSRQQLNVSTLYDLRTQLQTNAKTPVSYKLTSTVYSHGEKVHRMPAHRSTIYIHRLCNKCNGISD